MKTTTLQQEVLDILDRVYPTPLTTKEVADVRTGSPYDSSESYRALTQLVNKGLVQRFSNREHGFRSVSWTVIR